MKYLSLDIGEKRVGVAASDESGIIPRPILTLEVTDNFMEELGKIIAVEKPQKIIFGIPRHQDGEEGEEAAKIKKFANGVKHEYNVEVAFEDESSTSILAENRLREQGFSGEEIKRRVDTEAACIILESYLNK